MWMRRAVTTITRATVVLVVLSGLLAGAPSATARPTGELGATQAELSGSVVFILEHDVWLLDVVTGDARQLTFDGTAADPYEGPSQSNNGTIVAARGDFIHRMDPFGRPLGPPFEPEVVFELGVFNPAISPDGQLVAYWTGEVCNEPDGDLAFCTGTGITRADGSGASGLPDFSVFHGMPSWINNSRLALDYKSFYITYWDLTAAEPAEWFGNEPTNFSYEADPDVSADGGEIALAFEDSGQKFLRLDTLSGPAPTAPTPRCLISGPAGNFHSPSWNPQGTAVVWDESDPDQALQGEGMWIAFVGDLATVDCTQLQVAQLIPGATEPDWGPAEFVPGYVRTTTLSLSKHLIAKGSVSVNGDFNSCRSNVPVAIQRRKSGNWVPVKSANTSSSGAFSVKIADKPGTYRALAGEVTKSGALCLSGASPKRTHKH
jgi:hypothetical protein